MAAKPCCAFCIKYLADKIKKWFSRAGCPFSWVSNLTAKPSKSSFFFPCCRCSEISLLSGVRRKQESWGCPDRGNLQNISLGDSRIAGLYHCLSAGLQDSAWLQLAGCRVILRRKSTLRQMSEMLFFLGCPTHAENEGDNVALFHSACLRGSVVTSEQTAAQRHPAARCERWAQPAAQGTVLPWL